VRSRDDALAPDITLQGWSARGDGGLRLQKHFHHGPFAEQMLVPTENAIPIGPIEPSEAGRWCVLALLLVPYGGLLAANLQAGETLLVSGATGNFGSAAVAVALAMGAGCVIAPGRNETMLQDLARRFGHRVRTVKLTGDENEDRERMKQAAPGPIDCVIDLLPPFAGTKPVRAAAMTVRQFGRVVLMGGVGMLGGRRSRAALPVDHAELHHHHRPMDVPARGQHPDGRADPVRAAGFAQLGRHGIRSGSCERSRRARRRPWRPLQSGRDQAVSMARFH